MKNVTKTNVFFLGLILFYFVCIFLLRLTGGSWMPYNILLLLPEAMIVIAAVVYIRIAKPDYLKDIHMSMPDIGTVTETVFGTILVLPLVSIITIFVSMFSKNLVSETFDTASSNPLWMNLLLLALVPAICEEFVFRGLIFHGYKTKNPGKAIFMSAFLFALFHFNVNQFVYAFLLGIVFGILAYATGTIMTSVIAHFTFNGMNVMNAYPLNNGYTLNSFLIKRMMEVLGTGLVFLMVFFGVAIIGFLIAKKLLEEVCNRNRGYQNVVRIFSRDCLLSDGEAGAGFLDVYLIISLIVAILYTFFL